MSVGGSGPRRRKPGGDRRDEQSSEPQNEEGGESATKDNDSGSAGTDSTAGPTDGNGPVAEPPDDEPARFPTSEPRVPEETNPSPGGEPQARPPGDEPARFPTSEPRVPEETNPSPGGEPQARPPEDEPLRGPTSRPGTEESTVNNPPGGEGQRERPSSERIEQEASSLSDRFVTTDSPPTTSRGGEPDTVSEAIELDQATEQPIEWLRGAGPERQQDFIDVMTGGVSRDARRRERQFRADVTPGDDLVTEQDVANDLQDRLTPVSNDELTAAAALGVATPEPASTAVGAAILLGTGLAAASQRSELETPEDNSLFGSEVEPESVEATEFEAPTESETDFSEIEAPQEPLESTGEVAVPDPTDQTSPDLIQAQQLVNSELEDLVRRERFREEEEDDAIVPDEMVPDEEVFIGEDPTSDDLDEGIEEPQIDQEEPANDEFYREQQEQTQDSTIEEADVESPQVEFEEQFEEADFVEETGVESDPVLTGVDSRGDQRSQTNVDVRLDQVVDQVTGNVALQQPLQATTPELAQPSAPELAVPNEPAFPNEYGYPEPTGAEPVEAAVASQSGGPRVKIPSFDGDDSDRDDPGVDLDAVDELFKFAVADPAGNEQFVEDLEYEVDLGGIE